jgi:hypothetical protein
MLQKYLFKPGVDKENTRYTNEGKWWSIDKMRFRSGTPEKLGGWIAYTNDRFLGLCRKLFNWVDLDQDDIMAMGTSVKLYAERGGGFTDITPIVRVTDPALVNPFTTGAAGSSIITCSYTDHALSVGDYFIVSDAANLDGIAAAKLDGEHVVTEVVNANTFQFVVEGIATVGNQTGGGSAVIIETLLPTGLDYGVIGTGWGAGPWDAATTNGITATLDGDLNSTATTIDVDDTTGFTSTGLILIDSELISYAGITSTSFTGCVRAVDQTDPTSASTPQHGAGSLVQQAFRSSSTRGWGMGTPTGTSATNLRLWSFDNFGENLLANPRGGAIYYWEPALGYTSDNRAYNIADMDGASDVPVFVSTVISTDERHVVAFGANPIFSSPANPVLDPLLIRWSDQEDPAMWTPTATNSAGDLRVPQGSYIVTAQQTRQEILVWTDASLHSFQYIGPPYVFGLTTLSGATSIMGPNAAVTVNNITYWMGKDKFYAYSGRVETIPCSLRRYVFSNIDVSQGAQVHAGTNEQFGEIIWFYCSKGSYLIDKYVIFNYLENIWYYGDCYDADGNPIFQRTAWLDSQTRGAPFGAGPNSQNSGTLTQGTLFQHEYGTDAYNYTTETGAMPIPCHIESADFDIDDGQKFTFIQRVIPDITFQNSNTNTPGVTYTVKVRNFPGSSISQEDSRGVSKTASMTIDEYTNQVWVRLRGRQAAIRVESDELGVMWQLGSTRLDVRPDGRR